MNLLQNRLSAGWIFWQFIQKVNMRQVRFDLFRLSLRERTQIDLFASIDKLNREQWIRKLFSTPVSFTHHGTEFFYIPEATTSTSTYLLGKIGREVFDLEHTSPEDGYRTYIHEAWKAADVVVDPSQHEDGQKVAIQYLQDVGKPSTLAPRLLTALEDAQDIKHFLSAIHPITNSEAFWDFVRRNEGKITKIRFELEVPNMFGAEDEYEREMREFREKEKAQKVVIEIKNSDGIDPYTDRVQFTANKAMSQGTGRVKAKAIGKGNSFTSDEQQMYSKIEVSEEAQLIADEISLTKAGTILGRDED